MTDIQLHKELLDYRLAAGLYQRHAADALGCNAGKIGLIEKGELVPSVSELIILLGLYKVDQAARGPLVGAAMSVGATVERPPSSGLLLGEFRRFNEKLTWLRVTLESMTDVGVATQPEKGSSYVDAAVDAAVEVVNGDAPPVDLGEELKRLRETTGLTQRDVGLRIGSAKTNIQRIESGDKIPTVGQVKALLSVYGVEHGSVTGQTLVNRARVLGMRTHTTTVNKLILNEVQKANETLDTIFALVKEIVMPSTGVD